jgi:acetoin utilization protein AcuB
MLVRHYMSAKPEILRPGADFKTALTLMQEHGHHHLPVVDDAGMLVGIVAERDLMVAATHYMGSSVEISEVMHHGAITTTPDTPLTEAAMVMVNNKIGGLPVVKGGKVVGVITETDVFRAFVKALRKGEVIHHAAMIKGKARKHTPTPNKARKAVATKSARKAAPKK